MTQPTTQAIQQAREIAAEVAEAMEGCLCDDCMDHGTRIIAEALSVSAPEREELEALREYAREATKAITSLTAGGSEYFKGRIGEIYVADLPLCLERIRASKHALHKQLTAAINGATRP